MKTIINSAAKVIATAAFLSMTLGLFSTAQAQSNRLPGEQINADAPNSTQSLVLPTEMNRRAASSRNDLADAASVRKASLGSTSVSLATELPKAVDQALTQISLGNLMAGSTKVNVTVGGTTSLLDEQGVNVKVTYEARPVGGILTVRASMAPTFRGVGVSTRPTISRSVAMAVDQLDETVVHSIVRELTSEINQEFANN